jgi:hypothetical protein
VPTVDGRHVLCEGALTCTASGCQPAGGKGASCSGPSGCQEIYDCLSGTCGRLDPGRCT